ncbi:hypothetical protein MSPP1_003044 [Malassezia sp. CBS 17886]|nr:hypothetical protein MSPP1_003044 [Malassezia sp. CBS 17886]
MSFLDSIRVIELAGLAPVPYAGMILADYGADVVRIDRPGVGSSDVCARHKKSVALDLKKHKDILIRMVSKADVLLDPYRPGVLERLGLGPDELLKVNPRLVFVRLSGFGQSGEFKMMAGHDINYISLSGVLSLLGDQDRLNFPCNLMADFAGGGLMAVVGTIMALFQRDRTGKGQVIDANMVDGSAYVASWPKLMLGSGMWDKPRGQNPLDGGAPWYAAYKTKDGKFMTVGSVEPQFYQVFMDILLPGEEQPDQYDSEGWPALRKRCAEAFASKTQEEWGKIFAGTDACVTPVLEFGELPIPSPAPRFSVGETKQPPSADGHMVESGEHSVEVLKNYGFSPDEVAAVIGTAKL